MEQSCDRMSQKLVYKVKMEVVFICTTNYLEKTERLIMSLTFFSIKVKLDNTRACQILGL